ncbi:Hypothetical predicted protein [Lecanosticta acicola]|uniref:PRISE-like Rossmann-fold domain-containing protein n=1 Tax=Lecanosticta acicola TaxID=111012 RepID=A0AAI9ED10_9PEZI|nr:Hypothetical predicted protein [Lecanosticta acicola]
MAQSNHALIFGATGIQGWAVTNQLLNNYPTPNSFAKITALTNRPIDSTTTLWPSSPRLQPISGLDLLSPTLKLGLQARVPSIETVTHVFYCAYIYKSDPASEVETNLTLLKNAIVSLETLAPNLVSVILSTGTKAYGVHLISDFPFSQNLPLREDLPRIPEPYASQNFYYNQVDFLASQSKGKNWTFAELRPDAVVGFVPNNNVYSLAQALACYLSCYREIEGEGAECQFPGTEKSWTILSNDADQDIIAKFAIHAALNPGSCGDGTAYNVASNSKPSCWEEKWPVICEFVGLKGVGPPEGGSGPQPGEYLASHLEQWTEIEERYGLATGRVGNDRSLGGFQYFIMTMFDFDRHLDMAKMHAAWGDKKEEVGSKEVWWTAFQRYRNAKIIP